MSHSEAHIYYSGTVQGIGFRYATFNFARQLDLKGWVKNLPDGRVELLVEGPEDKINKLCQTIDRHFDGYIRNQEKIIQPARLAGRQVRQAGLPPENSRIFKSPAD